MQDLLATFSGILVGFVLGLIGGGGSVLAVPLLVYLVGVSSPHVAIGTSAVAVAVSALANLIGHAKAGNVKWPCALVFAAAGVAGAAIGSTLGKQFDGQKLLLLFGMLMIVIAGFMFWNRHSGGDVAVRLTRHSAPRLMPWLLAYGTGVGALSGFFGIGGGFLVVPGIMAATGMPMIYAIGSSLVSVFAFGITTAINYAISGLIDWVLVAFFIGGGIAGGVVGRIAAQRLSTHRQALATAFAVIVAAVGFYVVWRGIGAIT
ncbi:sulfite exporter TauE/SafE family protein [Hyphomicrobium sp. NDB2Meth4]|uniref:sulfite exporter TauE/SafE family protein n=1 Tax=Hyphomicrobium sp. NDB2Meth4 TaxID=1892846 RepID=UPI00092FFAE1|nr:sulfite exporter TauE/SafE family protein [Hyphomicrobium sp. NDB2Meth4]